MRLVYNSFYGRYSDSPRAVYERLVGSETANAHVWLVADGHEHGFPAGVDTVTLGSEECVAALESADAVVSNTYLELDWNKRPGTVYLQTWHGTPLKRIHYDAPSIGPDDRLERLDVDVARWDYLLSPNRPSTDRLRGAFRYDGTVVETGYPRNDVLLADDRELRRAVVRAELGLEEGTTAVLYAPTWRDDEYYAQDVQLGLDVSAFVKAMGDGWCLLPRVHYYMADRLALPQSPGVRDVSYYPDIRDLYLAADVLVTDYSSAMFDFAVTGKPMIFYTYDLAHYRDSVRGFYFDFVPEAPGPVVETMPELLDALHRVGATEERYADRYAAFRERYCHLEDGSATDRVIDLLARGC
ncbi:CDP-glycerol glycerophosphotransferase family protein [Blastococcus haudaquaticus]|uniref:CDP-glycerol:poly(Glycerophosphate) glycerophosphotransferase n=1 Tax=Blastococcus haudaquaticus TaxID=1938745 RepID=A0A286H1J6_9ACTN|nr:CDP-glycerol glycerophosphotransferase family protein [Blastococcus haudaquaticus]SOE01643.1 CDP-glycerol:poly(glycerophosphate) glycerophosphotransferase [Blastococcus haudaquaticus]